MNTTKKTHFDFEFERIRREAKEIAGDATRRRRKGLAVVALALAAAVIAVVAVAVASHSLPRAGLDYEGMSILSQQAVLAQMADEASRR